MKKSKEEILELATIISNIRWQGDKDFVLNAMQEYVDQQTKELKDEIEMKTNYYEDKLESQHIASSEHYKETQLLKDEIERLKVELFNTKISLKYYENSESYFKSKSKTK
jgi:hypothetical protein